MDWLPGAWRPWPTSRSVSPGRWIDISRGASIPSLTRLRSISRTVIVMFSASSVQAAASLQKCQETMAKFKQLGNVSAMLAQSYGYAVLPTIGKGGMGVVYEAEQDQPRRRVALKVIRAGAFADESQIRMFQREADMLARLKHLNRVQP